jgi:hypothetical protein
MNVVNVKDTDDYDVYIGRRNGRYKHSIWANPFKIGKDGTREEVIQKYSDWLKTQPSLMCRVKELKGKTLACWCAPEACHGHVLAKMAEEA